MTKQEFIDVVAKKVESQDVSRSAVRAIIDTTFEEMVKAIKKEKRFSVPGFGTFSVRARKAKTGRNPKTGEAIKIKASKTVAFKPAPSVKGAL
jgi:DNA-binding protein HU-beta